MAKSRAHEGNASHSMTKHEREWAINSLSFLVRDVSLGVLRELGITVGRGLYESAKKFSRSDEPIYLTPPENFPGRKRLREAPQIEDHWVQGSQIVSRTDAAGANLRVALGGKAKVAKSIADKFNCSVATAYNYCPTAIVSSRKHSDLCVYCESLRKVRLECIRLANKYGAGISELGELAGQNEVRGPGNDAAEYLKDLAHHEEVSQISRNLKTLTWRETLGRNLADDMRSTFGKRAVVCFDFSSSVRLASVRGDSDEFRRPISLSLFGLMFVAPTPDGGFVRKYMDVFSFGKAHTSAVAISMLDYGLAQGKKHKFLPTFNQEISFYSDKAKHFCSGEMSYGVLFEVSRGIRGCFYTYHACYHGKTALDAHFGQVKRTIANAPVARWPHTQREISDLVAESVDALSNTKAIFFRTEYLEKGERTKLIARDISCVQKFHRRTDGGTLVNTLIVEGTQTPIKTKSLLADELDEDDEAIARDLERHRESGADELRKKLLKQRKKLSYYQKV